MFFDQFLSDLPGVPRFQRFRYRDTNPLTGTTKIRLIGAPNPAMFELHQRLIRYLRGLAVPMPHAVGARPKGSPVTNVRRHRNVVRRNGQTVYRANRHFYLLDIVDAYGHVDAQLLSRLLCQSDSALAGEERPVQAFLQKFCFVPGSTYRVSQSQQQALVLGTEPSFRRGSRGLVQGSPSSPDLFNLYAAIILDRPLARICQQHGLTYTRYLDDLTFSSRYRPITSSTRRAIRRAIELAGFRISHRKAIVADLRRGPITINGVSIDADGRIFLPRWYVRKLRGLLHTASKDPSIRPDLVHGTMGVFLGTLPHVRGLGHLGRNRTEKKLVELYDQYRALIKRR